MELLTIKQLSLSVGNKQLVDGGSFSVFPGDVILLTGPNGCGKSTIIKFLLGATFEYKDLACSALTVGYKEEYDILKDEGSNELFRQNICYVSQEDEFESESILDCFINSIDSFVANEKEEYVFEFIKRFSIEKCFGLQGKKSIWEKQLSFQCDCRKIC